MAARVLFVLLPLSLPQHSHCPQWPGPQQWQRTALILGRGGREGSCDRQSGVGCTPLGLCFLGNRVPVGLASLPAWEHPLWPTVPCSVKADGRAAADRPQSVLPAWGGAPTRRRGSAELWPSLGDAVTSGYLLPLSKLQKFPHLENGEINTWSKMILMGPEGACESQTVMANLTIPAPGIAPGMQ